jgi:phospholipid-binding lipoprotein MlaA
VKRHTILALLAAALLAGCATTGPAPGTGGATGAAPAANPIDPWEGFNRRVFAFNEAIDAAVLKPVATAYRDVVPALVRQGVSNVLGNLGDMWSGANHFLQGKPQQGFETGMRVLTNTTFGLGGLLDPATEMGLLRRSEDFGQTLGVWGVQPGPYLVLPLFGPSNVRDTGGLVVDRSASWTRTLEDGNTLAGVTVLSVIDLRAGLLGTTGLVEQAALDKYGFIRDAYLARRLDQVYDGAPPLEAEPAEETSAPPAGSTPARKP